MLNYPPSPYLDVDDERRVVNTKKVVYSRRPWYAPAIDPAEAIRRHYNLPG
ncbi:hypothetical protein JYU34_001821 [Plutella xylostella]|uniref:Uncharacterized protein n=3 Tax=Plutella xylostella TaxID=51655 RepID=A0ABQ7R4V6_PLUXY|nr:hypothetical protein JYU34_001821 [Plutella xylostella]